MRPADTSKVAYCPGGAFVSKTGSFADIALAQHAVERPEPFATVRLLRQPFRPQQITQLRVSADNAERHMTRRQLIMEIEQHPRASQIDVGGCRKIADNQPDVRRFSQRLQNRLQNRLGIDVEQRGFRAERDDADQRLHALVPDAVGIAARSGKPSEKRYVGPRRPAKQQEDGCKGGKQHTLEDPKQQHGHERDSRGIEVDTAHSPHAKQRADVDQLVNSGNDNSSQHGLGKVGQQPRKEKQAEREGERAKHQCQGRARARRVIDGGLRQSAGDRIAVTECDGEVGSPQPQKFLPDIKAVSMLRGKTPRRRNTFDIGQQQTSGRYRK